MWRVSAGLAVRSVHLERLGRPPPVGEVSASDPRVLLAEAVTDLRNNADRMDDLRYRLERLSSTSSLVESLVGEFNPRVKGRSKLWNRPAEAEAIPRCERRCLGEDGRWESYFSHRPATHRCAA